MNLLQIDTVKFEKEKAMQRYRSFKKIASLARTLQFCFAFAFFSWSISRSSSYFPAAVDLFRFILRRLCLLVVNHHFGFLLGNLIIVTLFVKSGRSASNNCAASTVSGNADDYDSGNLIRQSVHPREMKVVSDEKQIVPAEAAFPSPADGEELAVLRTELETRKYRRTRSEEFEPDVRVKIQLRRLETEHRREMYSCAGESTGKRSIQVEDLSNEEFQRKVEAFIERQQRFLREESLSMAYGWCSA